MMIQLCDSVWVARDQVVAVTTDSRWVRVQVKVGEPVVAVFAGVSEAKRIAEEFVGRLNA